MFYIVTMLITVIWAIEIDIQDCYIAGVSPATAHPLTG